MRKLATNNRIVEDPDVILPAEEDTPDQIAGEVLLPDLDPQRTYKVMSPRLAHPEQAKDFVKEVIEQTEAAL